MIPPRAEGYQPSISKIGGFHTAGFVMLDGSACFDAAARKDSKLCNVLLPREFARQLEGAAGDRLESGSVIPSFEGFFRYNRQNNPVGMALFVAVADLLRVTESVQTAGGCWRRWSLILLTQALASPISVTGWCGQGASPSRQGHQSRRR